MNVEDIFSSTNQKRKLEEDQSHDSIKRPQQTVQKLHEDEDNELKLALKLLDSIEESPQPEYNKKFIVKLFHKLQPLLITNSELRSNYSSSTKQQLFDNESELLYQIKNLSELSIALSECPDLSESYHELINSDVFIQLITLISNHPNIVISRQIIQILNELAEDDEDSQDTILKCKYDKLGDFFNSCSISDTLLKFINTLESQDNLQLDEFKQESIILSLTFLVNLTSFQNEELIKSLILNNDLNDWIMTLSTSFKSPSSISVIQQYSMEYLTTLFTSTRNYKSIDINTTLTTMSELDLDIIELLLIVYNKFKKSKINTQSEEYIENAIQLLCHLLSHSNQANYSFVLNEGMELILMIIDLNTSNWHIRKSFMILSFVQLTPDSAKSFITNGGLKQLFKHFVKKGKGLSHTSLYCLKIINSLFKQLSFDSDERLRLLNKFMTKDYTNLKKLIQYRSSVNDTINKHMDDDSLDELDLALQLEFQVSLCLSWLIVDDLVGSQLMKNILSEAGLSIEEHITNVLKSRIVELGDSDEKDMLKDLADFLSSV